MRDRRHSDVALGYYQPSASTSEGESLSCDAVGGWMSGVDDVDCWGSCIRWSSVRFNNVNQNGFQFKTDE